MANYVYLGWGPETGPDGELARPFDEREFAEQPTWGRWALISEPDGERQSAAGQAPVIAGAGDGQSSLATPAAPAATAADTKGM